jgi:hypothetical protein
VKKLLLIMLLLVGSAMAQLPRPYAVGGISLNGGGYQTLSETVGAGIDLESTHLIGDVEADYENARKTNDGTNNNTKGRERYLQGRLFGRFSNGLYVGGGWQWSQTSTTNYTKQAWRPSVGVGKDFLRDTYSLRLQSLYIGKGDDKINGSQGVETTVYFPSPAKKGHLFFRESIGVYRFHSTVTDPSLSAIEGAQHHFTGYTTMSLIVRF